MLDLLKIFEIREEDLIPLSEKDRFRADKLIVPSLCRNYDYLPLFPHKKLMLRVKNWGAGRIDRDKLAKTKLLVKHLPMTSATWRSSLGNFDQLREKLEPLGFITVCPGEMSIDAQVTAFAGAQMIVGEDSSALHNIIYPPSPVKAG